jgi:hypothetical protein
MIVASRDYYDLILVLAGAYTPGVKGKKGKIPT